MWKASDSVTSTSSSRSAMNRNGTLNTRLPGSTVSGVANIWARGILQRANHCLHSDSRTGRVAAAVRAVSTADLSRESPVTAGVQHGSLSSAAGATQARHPHFQGFFFPSGRNSALEPAVWTARVLSIPVCRTERRGSRGDRGAARENRPKRFGLLSRCVETLRSGRVTRNAVIPARGRHSGARLSQQRGSR
jgi:hypothetical protein